MYSVALSKFKNENKIDPKKSQLTSKACHWSKATENKLEIGPTYLAVFVDSCDSCIKHVLSNNLVSIAKGILYIKREQ